MVFVSERLTVLAITKVLLKRSVGPPRQARREIGVLVGRVVRVRHGDEVGSS